MNRSHIAAVIQPVGRTYSTRHSLFNLRCTTFNGTGVLNRINECPRTKRVNFHIPNSRPSRTKHRFVQQCVLTKHNGQRGLLANARHANRNTRRATTDINRPVTYNSIRHSPGSNIGINVNISTLCHLNFRPRRVSNLVSTRRYEYRRCHYGRRRHVARSHTGVTRHFKGRQSWSRGHLLTNRVIGSTTSFRVKSQNSIFTINLRGTRTRFTSRSQRFRKDITVVIKYKRSTTN